MQVFKGPVSLLLFQHASRLWTKEPEFQKGCVDPIMWVKPKATVFFCFAFLDGTKLPFSLGATLMLDPLLGCSLFSPELYPDKFLFLYKERTLQK